MTYIMKRNEQNLISFILQILDILSFIMSATVDGRLVYRVGSVLNADDLDRYSSHRALAVFFLVDPKAGE